MAGSAPNPPLVAPQPPEPPAVINNGVWGSLNNRAIPDGSEEATICKPLGLLLQDVHKRRDLTAQVVDVNNRVSLSSALLAGSFRATFWTPSKLKAANGVGGRPCITWTQNKEYPETIQRELLSPKNLAQLTALSKARFDAEDETDKKEAPSDTMHRETRAALFMLLHGPRDFDVPKALNHAIDLQNIASNAIQLSLRTTVTDGLGPTEAEKAKKTVHKFLAVGTAVRMVKNWDPEGDHGLLESLKERLQQGKADRVLRQLLSVLARTKAITGDSKSNEKPTKESDAAFMLAVQQHKEVMTWTVDATGSTPFWLELDGAEIEAVKEVLSQTNNRRTPYKRQTVQGDSTAGDNASDEGLPAPDNVQAEVVEEEEEDKPPEPVPVVGGDSFLADDPLDGIDDLLPDDCTAGGSKPSTEQREGMRAYITGCLQASWKGPIAELGQTVKLMEDKVFHKAEGLDTYYASCRKRLAKATRVSDAYKEDATTVSSGTTGTTEGGGDEGLDGFPMKPTTPTGSIASAEARDGQKQQPLLLFESPSHKRNGNCGMPLLNDEDTAGFQAAMQSPVPLGSKGAVPSSGSTASSSGTPGWNSDLDAVRRNPFRTSHAVLPLDAYKPDSTAVALNPYGGVSMMGSEQERGVPGLQVEFVRNDRFPMNDPGDVPFQAIIKATKNSMDTDILRVEGTSGDGSSPWCFTADFEDLHAALNAGEITVDRNCAFYQKFGADLRQLQQSSLLMRAQKRSSNNDMLVASTSDMTMGAGSFEGLFDRTPMKVDEATTPGKERALMQDPVADTPVRTSQTPMSVSRDEERMDTASTVDRMDHDGTPQVWSSSEERMSITSSSSAMDETPGDAPTCPATWDVIDLTQTPSVQDSPVQRKLEEEHRQIRKNVKRSRHSGEPVCWEGGKKRVSDGTWGATIKCTFTIVPDNNDGGNKKKKQGDMGHG